MKAMVLSEIKPIQESPLVEADLIPAEPGPGQVRIKLSACAICHTDLHTIEGEIMPPKLPIIPGHQAVGRVERLGDGAERFKIGDRVGAAWLNWTCGQCRFCKKGNENLCENARFTGYHVHGGYAQYMVIAEDFAYKVPDVFSDIDAAPLLCAGIIGQRAFRLSGAEAGQILGIFGFGASAHLVLQIAVHKGCRVYVFSRGQAHRELALKLGASWAGGSTDKPPSKLESAIIFAPAGELVPIALTHLSKGGTLALAGIYMSSIPQLDYATHLYYEKSIRSVTASTRQDGEQFLKAAAEIPIRTKTQTFPLKEANKALRLLKEGKINGAGVLAIH